MKWICRTWNLYCWWKCKNILVAKQRADPATLFLGINHPPKKNTCLLLFIIIHSKWLIIGEKRKITENKKIKYLAASRWFSYLHLRESLLPGHEEAQALASPRGPHDIGASCQRPCEWTILEAGPPAAAEHLLRPSATVLREHSGTWDQDCETVNVHLKPLALRVIYYLAVDNCFSLLVQVSIEKD